MNIVQSVLRDGSLRWGSMYPSWLRCCCQYAGKFYAMPKKTAILGGWLRSIVGASDCPIGDMYCVPDLAKCDTF